MNASYSITSAYKIITKYRKCDQNNIIKDTEFYHRELDKTISSIVEYLNLQINSGKFQFTLSNNQYNALVSFGELYGIDHLSHLISDGTYKSIKKNFLDLCPPYRDIAEFMKRRMEEYLLFTSKEGMII